VDPGSKTRIAVTLSDGRGGRAIAPGLARWLARVAPASAPRDVAIALVSDARIRALNRRFRRRDQPTDVLSFEPSDIVIATGVARRQAREAGLSYGDELKLLALHGLLHLMGYDHHRRSDAGRMARLERRLRAKGGLRAGLIERAQAGPASTSARGPSDPPPPAILGARAPARPRRSRFAAKAGAAERTGAQRRRRASASGGGAPRAQEK
jgi:probable rRNA maturation factor